MSVMSVVDAVAAALIAVGVTFVLLSTVGLLRLPDVYSRLHASGLGTLAGVGPIVVGSALHATAGETGIHVKEILALVFLSITSPVSVHVIARMAYRIGVPLSTESVRDDMRAEARPPAAGSDR